MSEAQVPHTTTASTSFDAIFSVALEAYKKQTKKDITSHPLAAQLKSCDTPRAILEVLRSQVQVFDQAQSSDDEMLTRWLDPTVNVLFAFSVTFNNVIGLVFPPANAVFAGIGILLQAVKDVRSSRDALVDFFGRIEYFFKRLEGYIEIRPTAAMTDIIIKIVAEVLSILGIVTKEIGQGRMKKYLKRLVGRRDIEDALQRLDRLTQEEARMAAAETLKITRGVDNKVKDVDEKVEGVDEKVESVDMKVESVDNKVESVGNKVQGVSDEVTKVDDRVQGVDNKVGTVIEGGKETRTAIQQVANQVTEINRNWLRKNLRKWITPPDPSVNYNTARSAHHTGTAVWCTEGTTFSDWKVSGSLLWIHGKPGSGKSILSSVIIRDIKTMTNAGLACMAYFYFDFKDKGKQDSHALLSSLLVQLSDQSDQFCDVLLGLYSAHQDGSEQPTNDSLRQCFKDMLTVARQIPIYLVVDALDECPNSSGIPSSREQVLELVNELVELRHPSLHLCVTSRPDFDIFTALEPLATQQISLHDESGQKQDIAEYVSSVVRSDRRMKRWRDEDQNAVIEKLTEKADGMFRWVFCQLEVLRHCFPTSVRRVIEELPESLDETYEHILKGIKKANRELAFWLLQCLTVAVRPLRVEELAEVLAVDFSAGGIPKLNADWRWEDQEEAVLSACSSLVTVNIDGGGRVVQFSHFSVKEFLTSDRLADSIEDISEFHILFQPAHAILAQACLGVLLRLNVGTIETIPLVQYAARHWVEHTQFENVESRVKDAMDYFFDMDKPHFSTWVHIHDVDDIWEGIPKNRGGELTSAAPSYYAALCGFHGLVERLIVKHPQHVNTSGGLCGTPLHASLFWGHLEVAKFLIGYGADVNAHGIAGWTPLHIISHYGFSDFGRWLLDHGADVNSRQESDWTPLHLAAFGGNLEISRLLLGYNAEVNVWDGYGRTPLQFASEKGHLDVAQALLGCDMHAHARDNIGESLLRLTTAEKHPEVAGLLPKLNVEIDVQDHGGWSPLCQAVVSGHADIVRLLLDHDADVHVHDVSGRTPLHLAVAGDDLEIVRTLLEHEHQADVNAQNDEGSTPIHKASNEGQLELVQLLLDHGADLQVRDGTGQTPLHLAAASGHLKVSRILLQHKAEVNARNDEGHTPFHLASRDGSSDMVRLLLGLDVDVHVRDKTGKTPLHLAAANGGMEVIRVLLEHKAEVNARSDEGITPLHEASAKGRLHVLQFLLDHGADADARNSDGKSPYDIAWFGRRRQIGQLLSKYASK